MPEGHLLLQAGKQFEWLTGGYINCGFHEVIYTDKTEEARKKLVGEGSHGEYPLLCFLPLVFKKS